MGQALYRKYRSRSFDEVIGQEPITETLKRAIKSGRISHAYLLSGPRGVGKTSVARILAHEVNNLPYKDETIHLDIIEIDAASNRRIDEIRDIREKVHIAPTSAKYKVYIIDEVHMLTKEAFNALLKTLEEPPAHCIFILATTEAHKLPETIISRTQHFNFKPVEREKAAAHLNTIAKKEKIDIEPAALDLLAEHGGGSFRDSISLLDQLSGASHKVTVHEAQQMLGLPKTDAVQGLVDAIKNGDPRIALQILNDLRPAGVSPAFVVSLLSKQLRSEIIGGANYGWASSFLRNLLDVSSAKQPFEVLELAVLEAAQQNPGGHTAPIQKFTPRTGTKFSLDDWSEVVAVVKRRTPALHTALRLAEPKLQDNRLILGFQFPLHKNKVNESRYSKLISDIIEEMSGDRLEVQCVLVEKKTKSPTQSTQSAKSDLKSQDLTAISSIFGNAELLES